jgi:hypothetical protein
MNAVMSFMTHAMKQNAYAMSESAWGMKVDHRADERDGARHQG